MQKQPCQPIPLYEFQNIDPERNIESMNNQHSFRHRGVCAMAMPKLMFCILASLAVLVATSCPDYLVNRTRCNPVNDIVGTSAATCQDDPDFYIENLGDDFKETQLTQLITPQKLYIYICIYIYICLLKFRLRVKKFYCTSTSTSTSPLQFPVSFAWDEGLLSTGFSNNLCQGMPWSGVLNVDFQWRCLVKIGHMATFGLAIFPLDASSFFTKCLKTLLSI